MPLKVKSLTKKPGIVIISPIGSIDAHTYSILDKEVDDVLARQPDVVIFDMEFAGPWRIMNTTLLIGMK